MMFQRVRTLQEGCSNVVKTHFYTDGSFSCVPSKWYQKIQHQPILHSRYPGRVYSRFQKSPILKVA